MKISDLCASKPPFAPPDPSLFLLPFVVHIMNHHTQIACVFLFILLLSALACAVDGNVDDRSQVREFEIRGPLEVQIIQCFNCRASIDADSSVRVEDQGDRWVVSGDSLQTVVINAQDLDLVRTYGSAVVEIRGASSDLLQAEAYNASQLILTRPNVRQLELLSQDSSRIDVAGTSSALIDLRASDSSDVVLSGRTGEVKATVRQDAVVDASQLDAQRVQADLRNSAQASFCASDRIDSTIGERARLAEECR